MTTALPQMTIPAHFVVKDTVIAEGDTIAIEAVGNQIATDIGAVEIGAAVEAAAEARPKIVMTEDTEATAKAVVAKVAATAAAEAPAWTTKATELLGRLVEKPNALNVRWNLKRLSPR